MSNPVCGVLTGSINQHNQENAYALLTFQQKQTHNNNKNNNNNTYVIIISRNVYFWHNNINILTIAIATSIQVIECMNSISLELFELNSCWHVNC